MAGKLQINKELNRYIHKYGKFGETEMDVLLRFAVAYDKAYGEKTPEPVEAPVRKNLSGRAPRGSVTQAEAYKPYVLMSLSGFMPGHSIGGLPPYSAPSVMVLEVVKKAVKDKVNPVDWEMLPSGVMRRIDNKIMWCRHELVKEGLMKPKSESGHGIWALTEQGLKAAMKITAELTKQI